MKKFGTARRRVPALLLAGATAALSLGAAGCSLISRFDAPTRDECDEAQKKPFYRDGDGDGFGTNAASTDVVRACFAPVGFAPRSGDCNDADPAVNPDAQELCDRQDNDCSSGGGADPTEDADNDGHAPVAGQCAGGTLPKDDCDDSRREVVPGNEEACDGLDNDCNGQTDENPAADAFCAHALHAASSCHGGSCISACAAGFADCDGDGINGCETPVTDDVHNCGGCRIDCGIGGTCEAGFCRERVIDVAAGVQHTCAVRGTSAHAVVVCWGSNEAGQLGVASVPDARLPVTVAGLTNATQLAVGTYHSCALAGGQVYCWGLNDFGQIGQDEADTPMSSTPAAVPGLAGVAQLAASGSFNCARTDAGEVECWGDNRVGQLGRGSITDSEPDPAPVENLPDATLIALGGGDLEGTDENGAPNTGHACAIRADGSVACWGDNNQGQLGAAPSGPGEPVTAVTNLPAGVNSLALGYQHSCAVVGATGAVLCWGADADGQLGRGTFGDASPSPVQVLLGEGMPVEGASRLAAQGSHACAHRDRDVLCWGDNAYGELGNGDLLDSGFAVTVDAMPDAELVASGWYHTCAVRRSGQLACWGDNESGQLGDGTNARRREPVRVPGLSSTVRIAGGSISTCGLRADGTVSCWGHESTVNGVPSADDQTDLYLGVPQPVAGITNAVELSVGIAHACVRERPASGAGPDRVVCWGVNDFGQLGSGLNTLPESAVPLEVPGLTDPVQLSTSHDFACARQATGPVVCWGDNFHQQLGRDSGGDPLGPTSTTPPVTDALEVAAGGSHACVRRVDGTVACWGSNESGQLGVARDPGGGVDVPAPTPVPGIADAVQIVTGARHSCVLHGTGTVSCWGANDSGQLGDGTFLPQTGPVAVANLSGVTQLAAGAEFTCAHKKDGTAWCWGRNGFGQLGVGNNQDSASAAAVMNVNNVLEVSAGRDFACARVRSGDLVCWGRNDVGQLGDQTDNDSAVPVTVRSLP